MQTARWGPRASWSECGRTCGSRDRRTWPSGRYVARPPLPLALQLWLAPAGGVFDTRCGMWPVGDVRAAGSARACGASEQVVRALRRHARQGAHGAGAAGAARAGLLASSRLIPDLPRLASPAHALRMLFCPTRVRSPGRRLGVWSPACLLACAPTLPSLPCALSARTCSSAARLPLPLKLPCIWG